MRRVPTVQCHSMEDALSWVGAIPQPHLIVIDVEPGVIGWHASPGDRNRELVRVNALLTDAGHAVWFVSNGSFAVDVPLDVRVTTHARKPWTSIQRRPPDCAHMPCVVIGDQVWTDGLLAFRLGGILLLIDLPEEGVPPWPRWQRRLSWTPRLLFSDETRA